MMYRTVHRQESRTSAYGIGSLDIRSSTERTDNTGAVDENGNTARTNMSTSISRSISRRASAIMMRRFTSVSNGMGHSNSRAVLHRALAYSLGYMMTWIWTIIYMVLDVAGALALAPPYPKWQIGFQFLTVVSILLYIIAMIAAMHDDVSPRLTIRNITYRFLAHCKDYSTLW